MRGPATSPLTLAVAVTSWTPDLVAVTLIVLAALCYSQWYRRGHAAAPGRAWCFGAGLALCGIATLSVIAVYALVLFWMRALQVLLLMFVAPFLLALGRPVATLRGALGEAGRGRLDRVLSSAAARVVCSPLTTSVAMLATPWLLYMTRWYVASMTGPIAALTRMWLVLIGFGYFYARLQADPVPRRFSPLLSIGISVVETLGDGLLGLVLWLGPLIAYDYYRALDRNWGPNMRLDQTLGAGILWILGDVIGVPFLVVLMRALSVHERVRAREVDVELDVDLDEDSPPASTLWWQTDPELRERFDRH